MSFTRLAENRIREAMEDGAFDNLSNRGQPIDLEEYFRQPEDLRMAYSILKNANCLPEEVTLLNDLARLDRELGAATDLDERKRLTAAAQDIRLKLSILMERRNARPQKKHA